MGRTNPEMVAKRISETVSKNKLVVLGDVIKEAGYSESVSRSPQRVTNTKAFKRAMELEKKPIIEGLQREINEIKLAMSKKNKNNEEYRTLVGSLDILTKNYQLLSGGATERQVFVLPSEVMERNKIQQIDDNVNSKNGSIEPFSE